MMGNDKRDDFGPIRANTVVQIPIRTVFNFESTHWHGLFENAALPSFDEELEIYVLLDLDTQGEEILDLDDSMGDTLLI